MKDGEKRSEESREKERKRSDVIASHNLRNP